MVKHKQSTFERLHNGKLQWNRKERRELEHLFPSPCLHFRPVAD